METLPPRAKSPSFNRQVSGRRKPGPRESVRLKGAHFPKVWLAVGCFRAWDSLAAVPVHGAAQALFEVDGRPEAQICLGLGDVG